MARRGGGDTTTALVDRHQMGTVSPACLTVECRISVFRAACIETYCVWATVGMDF